MSTSTHKKRLALGAGLLAVIAAIGTIAAGVTFGFFSAYQPGPTNSFTAGKVTLTNPASTVCNVSPMSPGDGTAAGGGTSNNSSEVQCTFQVTYSGTSPAWIGLDVAIASTHVGVPVQSYGGTTPSASPGLYDSTANGLQVLLQDNQTTPTVYMNSNGLQSSTTAGTYLGGSATTGANPTATDLLVSKTSFANNTSVTFTIDYNLPTSANNGYQQAASTITLTAHAVQASNNGSTSSCTVGSACSGITWS